MRVFMLGLNICNQLWCVCVWVSRERKQYSVTQKEFIHLTNARKMLPHASTVLGTWNFTVKNQRDLCSPELSWFLSWPESLNQHIFWQVDVNTMKKNEACKRVGKGWGRWISTSFGIVREGHTSKIIFGQRPKMKTIFLWLSRRKEFKTQHQVLLSQGKILAFSI